MIRASALKNLGKKTPAGFKWVFGRLVRIGQTVSANMKDTGKTMLGEKDWQKKIKAEHLKKWDDEIEKARRKRNP